MSRHDEQHNSWDGEDGRDEIFDSEGCKIGSGETLGARIEGTIDAPTSTQECYVTLIGAPGIAEKIDKLWKLGKERGDEEIIELGRILKWEFGRLCNRAVSGVKIKKKAEALAIVAQDWGWQHKNLGYDLIYLIRSRCEVPIKDLAMLLGLSEAAVFQGISRHEARVADQNRLYEDSEKHERADLLMERIYRYIMDPNFPAMDRDKLHAARSYVELYNKQLERDTSLIWRQVSMVSDWFFTELLPTLQQRIQSGGNSVNVRHICLELFEKLSGDIRSITTKLKLPANPTEEKDTDAPKLTKAGLPRKKTGRPPKGGRKHV